jgi:hypothetical protein
VCNIKLFLIGFGTAGLFFFPPLYTHRVNLSFAFSGMHGPFVGKLVDSRDF